tara:strand:+ start:3324 stop:4220 length:897 start_codon:yes stop_codon:yes gene_type:complete
MFSLWVPKKTRVYPLEIYASILDKWSPSLAQFPITKNISVISNVDLYLSAKSTHNLETLQGENSTIHELTLNDGQVFILKKDARRGHSIREEAQLQQYATPTHAPQVYAFDNSKILMEKCTPLAPEKHKTFGLLEKGIKLFQFREQIFQFNSISRALSATRLLPRTVALFDEFGLFSIDVHRGNFLQRDNTVVHIDFDEMRFQTQVQYDAFCQSYPGPHTKRVLSNTPADPPHYYWWSDSILEETDQKTWSRQRWMKEMVTMKQLYHDIQTQVQLYIAEKLESRRVRLYKRVAAAASS